MKALRLGVYDSTTGVAIQRALCPVLVGREGELTELEDALLASIRGEGQVVLLAGDAGMGKTRLATELAERGRQAGTTVLWGVCSEAELALPYLPFLQALGNYLASADMTQLRDRLGPLRHELAHLFPQLERKRSAIDPSDPTQSKLRLFEAVLALLAIATAERGQLLVVEDLHWADASTRELLDYLSRRLHSARLMVLGTYRRDEVHRKHPLLPLIQGWRRSGLVTLVELEQLAPAQVAEMVTAIFDEPTEDETRDFLHARSEGNPFVLEELLKTALDRGDIFRSERGWERRPLSDFKLPETVRDTILLRLDRLQPEEVEALRAASVLGSAFRDETLVSMLGRDEENVQKTLHACVLQQLLEEEPQAGDRYRFRHALTREAIYEDLIAAQRQRLHSRAADVLADGLGTPAVELCNHLLAARRWQEAVPVCLRAGDDAAQAQAYGEAAVLYERALPFVSERLERGRLLCRLGESRMWAGDRLDAQGDLQEGIQLLEESGERRAAARYRLWLGRYHWLGYRPDLAWAELERAREILEPEGPSEELALTYVRLAGQHMFNLEPKPGLEMARRAVEVASAAGADVARIWAYNYIGVCLSLSGEVDAGLQWLQRSYQEAREHGLRWWAGSALVNQAAVSIGNLRAREALKLVELGRRSGVTIEKNVVAQEAHAYLVLGETSRALEAASRAIELSRQSGEALSLNRAEVALAVALSQADRLEEACEILSPPVNAPDAMEHLARARARMPTFLDAGRLEKALAAAATVFEIPKWPLRERRELGDRAVEVFLGAGQLERAEDVASLTQEESAWGREHQLRLEGRIALARGDLKKAAEQLSEAAAIWAEAGYREEEARTRRALAEALARSGNRAGAIAQLRQVLEDAEPRGAAFSARKAREILAELGVELEPPPSRAEPESGGEKLVTVLFADVRGYSALTQQSAPATVAEKISAFQLWVGQEVRRQHGVVDKFAGDAVMATFNVSGQQVDHALDALRAAIAIRDKAVYLGLEVGIGIATGAAVVGHLADGGNRSVLGEAANLASRLDAQAGPGEILVSHETHRRLEEALPLQVQPERLQLKGFQDPVEAYRLTSQRTKGGFSQPAPVARFSTGAVGVTTEASLEPSGLTRRQLEVAALVAKGLTNRQIAEKLVIAERTAEGHVEQIRNKLGFSSRSQVAAWAVEHGVSAAT